ncbi:hypothetical protein J2Z31_004817 [Sinorhizobium kostiense]|uniref:Uncharacterized protein n=1 Tax=Sinorhizobium kostiense TaxID=76747 RepID=A0ABS4R5W0_9HYPH|nr:hypothetical protein [Sinorhizobium kostiense]MBP2238280.1 hypothetical protein [Sinorhizobium kostiense]
MAALTLAVANPNAAERRVENFAPPNRSMPQARKSIRPADRSSPSRDDRDFLLALLARAGLVIERLASERRAANAARNWVETRRQLAKLPSMVRDDLLHAELSVIGAPDKDVRMERQPITIGDGKHQTYSFD